MINYTTHSDAIFDTGKPILGSTALEARDNLISVAEGGPGAPRIQPAALELAHSRVSIPTSGTSISVTGLDNFDLIELSPTPRLVSIQLGSAGDYTLGLELSDDDGVTYAALKTIKTGTLATSGTFTAQLPSFIDLRNGYTLGGDLEGSVAMPATKADSFRITLSSTATSYNFTTGGGDSFFVIGLGLAP